MYVQEKSEGSHKQLKRSTCRGTACPGVPAALAWASSQEASSSRRASGDSILMHSSARFLPRPAPLGPGPPALHDSAKLDLYTPFLGCDDIRNVKVDEKGYEI